MSVWTFGNPLQPIRLRVARPEDIVAELVEGGYPPMDTKVINSVETMDPEVEKALDEKFSVN